MQRRSVPFADAVTPIGILHHGELPVGRNQCIDQPLGRLIVHVVVSLAVHHQQVAAELVRVADC